MSDHMSHWGVCNEVELEGAGPATGAYDCPRSRSEKIVADIVLTEAGELLIHRSQKQAEQCIVGIVIAKAATALTRPQVERMLRAWDIGLAVANGAEEAVELRPMPHHWRFSRVDYMTWDEWLQTHPNAQVRAASYQRRPNA